MKYTGNVVQGKQDKRKPSRHHQFVWRVSFDIVGVLIVLLTVCGSSTTALGPHGACTVDQLPQGKLVV
jgi:hypothetical protein